ncbi:MULTISPECIES: NAD(P)-binding protein [Bacillus]|uniref:NAD(P)-binding protein n=1 Tax=Bacillus TaxID=1386 RepID=UPI000779F2BD|nr:MULTISPECIES: NAD(P)/FAD-dependent oxidoreductase [Bacillus cereus group]OTY60765.1 NAD(FAD)-utilizing dehydrogenase [Bacillus thuringiensis serovar graciosensis]PFD90758.1 NAD(FAD)-utilizing dehydrogenase [Bacillus anthracis]KXY86756.1 NAD(FAD)-utilizing dehydrogenase [Bacillus cereus]MBG9935476.1 NAD(FAD)-utilizing dehydrogenase [Bacillus tropicus]MED2993659.1 NAD(P)/FAD-dependent oxidoreductase [Bacillus tropicus]
MYDVTIIGAGVSSIFMAYSLAKSNKKVLILDKGKALGDRYCPLDEGKACNCTTCDKYFGFAGLGKSEGKFNYTNGFGGELEQKVGKEGFIQLMAEVDEILCQFGGNSVSKYSTENPTLNKRAESCGLQMLTTEVRHLGTTLSSDIFQQLYEFLLTKINIQFHIDVQHIMKQKNHFTIDTNEGTFQSRQLVFATGRSGADWLKKMCTSLHISQEQTRVDLGIRVEMKEHQLRSILKDTFETKLSYEHKGFTATTYCMNPKGRIIRKYEEGLVMPDGQNFREKGTGTPNLNFTLFIPRYFPTLKEANLYASSIIKNINQGRDRIVIQRLEDLLNKQPTTNNRMKHNLIQPTLQGDYGDLNTEIPPLYIEGLKEFLLRLEQFIQEPIDKDTLLYGIDGKFYAPTVKLNNHFETSIHGLFLVGDCSGVTHSLSQAAASGLYVGKYLSDI